MQKNLSPLTAIAACILFLSTVANAAVTISNFGTGSSISSATFSDTWIGSLSENATTSTIGSPATDFGNFLLVTPLNLTGNNGFSLTAKLDSGNTATGFIVLAYNTPTDFASAAFTASGFNSSSFSTVTSAWSTTGSFNPAGVIGWSISGGAPSSTTVFRVSFDNLQATAVPEPGTIGLLALAAGSGIFLRLRRRG